MSAAKCHLLDMKAHRTHATVTMCTRPQQLKSWLRVGLERDGCGKGENLFSYINKWKSPI